MRTKAPVFSVFLILSLLFSLFPLTLVQPALAAGTTEVIADFEGGVPAGWFVYGDWGAGTTIDTTDASTGTHFLWSLQANTVPFRENSAYLHIKQRLGIYNTRTGKRWSNG